MRITDQRRTRIAAEIRAELARQQKSQTWLSDAAGITKNTLRSRLQGVQPFWVHELDKISQVLGIKLSELIIRSDVPEEDAS